MEKVIGGLVLRISDDIFITVGDMKIYLEKIQVTGSNGGKKAVSLRFVGPKDIDIKRHSRD